MPIESKRGKAGCTLHRRTSSTASAVLQQLNVSTLAAAGADNMAHKAHRRVGSNLSASITASLLEENRCGWFCIKPNCMQRCAHPLVFLIALCGMVFAQSIACSGYLSSINTTIEKRYGLRSNEIGLIYASYEVACITATIFISYFGHR